VLGNLVGGVRSDGHDRRTAIDELLMILTQLRQVLAAEGSKEAAQEHQHDVAVTKVLRQRPRCAVDVRQREVRSTLTRSRSTHRPSLAHEATILGEAPDTVSPHELPR
jgi:hypothetical protein